MAEDNWAVAMLQLTIQRRQDNNNQHAPETMVCYGVQAVILDGGARRHRQQNGKVQNSITKIALSSIIS